MIERDRWCPVCGLHLSEVAVHHRLLRKHGGTDSAVNLLALHPWCHNIAPGSVHQNPALAYEKGWLVHSWDDPAQVPVHLPGGRVAFLTEDADYRYDEIQEIRHGW